MGKKRKTTSKATKRKTTKRKAAVQRGKGWLTIAGNVLRRGGSKVLASKLARKIGTAGLAGAAGAGGSLAVNSIFKAGD